MEKFVSSGWTNVSQGRKRIFILEVIMVWFD